MRIFCKPKYRVAVILGDAGAWYWRVTSTVNGQVVAHSESYSAYDACLDTALAVAKNADWPCTGAGGKA